MSAPCRHIYYTSKQAYRITLRVVWPVHRLTGLHDITLFFSDHQLHRLLLGQRRWATMAAVNPEVAGYRSKISENVYTECIKACIRRQKRTEMNQNLSLIQFCVKKVYKAAELTQTEMTVQLRCTRTVKREEFSCNKPMSVQFHSVLFSLFHLSLFREVQLNLVQLSSVRT